MARKGTQSATSSAFLTVREAAAATHRTPQTIRRKIAAGELPATRLSPRGSLLVPAESIVALLIENRVEAPNV